MTTRDRLLALLVALLWGLNFLAIRIGLDHFPPFFFAGLRFLVIAVPVLLFVPRPRVRWRWLLLFGTGFGTMQFAFLFLAIASGMPTGLASLVLQASAPFTVLLGAVLLKERVSARQLAGIGVAILGMVVIAWDRALTAALLPVLLTVLAALGWALGNMGNRLARPDSALRLTLWMTTVPPLPLLALSAVIEGPTVWWDATGRAFTADGWPGLVALAYIVLPSTIVGSGIWTALHSRYPAGVVAPFSLLIPVVGVAGAWVALGEVPTVVSLLGGLIVIAGVVLGLPPRGTALDSSDAMGPGDHSQDRREGVSPGSRNGVPG